MITLTNGYPQGPNGLIVPNGSIKFQLNVDATIIAAPGGFVFANVPVVFQFNSLGQIQPNTGTAAQIWSNEELQPQLSPTLLGTYYLVTFYDQNGALLNDTPLWWQFPNTIGSTVDISNVTPISTVGGNIIFYPTSFAGGGGSVTSVAFVGDGIIMSATPSTPVTASGNVVATLLTQSANTVLAGPTTGAAATPTFRALVTADFSGVLSGGIWNVTATKTGPYNAVAGDMVIVDTSGGGVTITLPAAVSNSMKSIRVKKISSDINLVTVARSSADLIDGLTSQTFSSQYTALEVTSDGVSNWWIG